MVYGSVLVCLSSHKTLLSSTSNLIEEIGHAEPRAHTWPVSHIPMKHSLLFVVEFVKQSGLKLYCYLGLQLWMAMAVPFNPIHKNNA